MKGFSGIPELNTDKKGYRDFVFVAFQLTSNASSPFIFHHHFHGGFEKSGGFSGGVGGQGWTTGGGEKRKTGTEIFITYIHGNISGFLKHGSLYTYGTFSTLNENR